MTRKCGGLSGIIRGDLNSGKGANKGADLRAGETHTETQRDAKCVKGGQLP